MRFSFLFFCLCFMQLGLKAQSAPSLFDRVAIGDRYAQYAENVVGLSLDNTALRNWVVAKPENCQLAIPFGKNDQLVLELTPNSVVAPDFKVTNQNNEVLPYLAGLYYKGFVRNHPGSMVALSVFNNQVVGLISTQEGTFVLGTITDAAGNPTSEYVLYNDSNLKQTRPFHCGSDDIDQPEPSPLPQSNATEKVIGGIVNVFFTADFATYQSKGSNVSNTINYITSIFNQSVILYDSINVNTQISEVNVFTAADPYANLNDVGDILNAYGLALAGNFNGDLAHFVSVRSLGGGVAWLGGLCSTQYSYAVSAGLGNIGVFPTYSWAVNVISHEMGHNLSSDHTHACTWGPNNNSRIDICGPNAGYDEGTCTVIGSVANGGTIMSYCHLTSVGVNFQQHFGALPGARIYNYVNNAECLELGNPFTCAGATPLVCGIPYSGNVNTGTDTRENYPCTETLMNGKERLHALTLTEPKLVSVAFAGTTNMKLFYGACDDGNCSDATTGFTNVEFAAGTYFFMVDKSANSAVGAYTITVTCNPLPICPSSGGTTDEHISSVTIGDFTNTSGNNGGYLNVDNTYIALTPGQTVNFSLTPGFANSSFSEYFDMWIDYNDNKIFETSERLTNPALVGNTVVTGSFIVPTTNIVLGQNLKLRIKMYYDIDQAGPCGTYTYGETEDYIVIIAASCPAPVHLLYTGTAATAGDFSWYLNNSASSYEVRYRLITATGWTTISQQNTFSKSVTGLIANSNYRAQIRNVCGTTVSAWSAPYNFNTNGVALCGKPKSSTALNMTANSARLIWPFNATATKYQVRYRTLNGSTFGPYTIKTVTPSAINLVGLAAGTNYKYQIRTYCNGAYTPWSTTFGFNTLALLPDGLIAFETTPLDFSLFPNPTDATFQIALPANTIAAISVRSVTGQLMATQINYESGPIDIAACPAGVYFVTVTVPEQLPQTLRLVKQ